MEFQFYPMTPGDIFEKTIPLTRETLGSILSLIMTPVFIVVKYFCPDAQHDDLPRQPLPAANVNTA